jgi:hypothetical protein
MTPAEKWASSAAPLKVIEPDRLRWMLMADHTRRVNKDGIHFQGAIFIAPELVSCGGETVQIRYMPHDLRSIEIFTEHGWLCTAYPQDQLTREQAEAVPGPLPGACRRSGGEVRADRFFGLVEARDREPDQRRDLQCVDDQ